MLKERHTPRFDSPVSTTVPTFTVDLPSRGIFYPDRVKSVKVSPLTIKQVRMLRSVNPKADKSSVERAIAEVVRLSVHGFEALDMTYGDFIHILYWLRINSFKKSPIVVTTTSKFDGRPIDTVVDNTKVKVVSIDEAKTPITELGYTTLRDNILLLEIEDPAKRYIAEFSTFLKPLPNEDFEARILRLEKREADLLNDIRRHQFDFAHGVNESVDVDMVDEEGRVEVVRVPVTLDLANFFP